MKSQQSGATPKQQNSWQHSWNEWTDAISYAGSAWRSCRQQRPAEGEETFSPAVNERSMRMALTKQIRELHDEVPAYQRLGALHRQAPKQDSSKY